MKESESFAYKMAYNLREPLMSVKGLLNLMRIDPERKNLDEYFRLMEVSVDRMTQSIHDIMAFSEEEPVKVLLEEINLKEIVEDAIQSHYFMKGIEHMSFVLAIEKLEFISDHKSLFTIFNNLISIAIRHRDPAKSSFVKVSASANSEDVEIIFEDNGLGMDELAFEKITERNESDPEELGFHLVKKALEKLDGKLYVQSSVGEGTTFTVQVPILFRKE